MAKRQIDLNEVNEMLKAGAPFARVAKVCSEHAEVRGASLERLPRVRALRDVSQNPSVDMATKHKP